MKFLLLLSIILTQATYAQSSLQAQEQLIKDLVGLIKQGEQMNLYTTAQVLGEAELYDHAVFDNDDAKLLYSYYIKAPNNPLVTVNYSIWLNMAEGFNTVAGVVEYQFKKGQCPSIDTFERIIGSKAITTQAPISPDLWTGQGGSYVVYYFHLPNDKIISVSNDGCRMDSSTQAKLT